MLIDEGLAQLPVIAAASVPTPPVGSAVLFFNQSNANRLSQKDSAGAVIDLAATGSGGGTKKIRNVGFNSGVLSSSVITVTDVDVSPANPPYGFFAQRAATVLDDASDMELNYSFVLTLVSTGSFQIRCTASDPEGDSLTGLPIQGIILNYFT